jgi:Ca2+-binding RTX toxin-like protein
MVGCWELEVFAPTPSAGQRVQCPDPRPGRDRFPPKIFKPARIHITEILKGDCYRGLSSAFITPTLADISQEQDNWDKPMFNLYMIGNSLTDEVLYQGFYELVGSQNVALNWGRHMIPGAPLDWIWNNPNSGFQQQPYGYYPQALSSFSWNAITLQPYDRLLNSDVSSVQQYLDLLAPNSPDADIFIFAQWPRFEGQDWETQWLRPYTGGWDGTFRTKDYYETLTRTLQGMDLDANVYMIPVGHVMHALHQKMQAGLVPGYTSITQLYADNTHLNSVGSYIVATTFYATLFRTSPVGLPVPAAYQADQPISADLAAIIQRTAWDVVTAIPISGVVSTGDLGISTAALPNAVEDQAYLQTLSAVGGIGPYQWEVVDGDLPPGLSLSPTGVLSGTPLTPGEYTITVRVADSTNVQVVRSFTLINEVDSIPQINRTPLPEGARGSAYHYVLSATGGNGAIAWELASGALPQGMTLRPDGQLVGTPGVSGTYTFEVRATDSDATPDSDIQSFTLTIGPAAANTLIIPHTPVPVVVDGQFGESVWSLPYTLEQPGGDRVRFGALWDDDYLYLAIDVEDDTLVSVPNNPWAGDGIRIFIDANHAREEVFSGDDRQFMIDLDGTIYEPSGRTEGVRQAVQIRDRGYGMEVAIPWSNLGIEPGENLTIGFDLSQDDDDGDGRRDPLVWHGTDVNAPAPNQFGNLLLSSAIADPVVPPTDPVDDPSDDPVIDDPDDAPSDDDPGDDPVADDPIGDDPVVDDPVVDDPVAEDPDPDPDGGGDDPVADDPGSGSDGDPAEDGDDGSDGDGDPVEDDPRDDPSSDDPSSDDPIADEPVPDDPGLEEDDPVTDNPDDGTGDDPIADDSEPGLGDPPPGEDLPPGDVPPTFDGYDATIYVNDNNIVMGAAYQAGQIHDGNLFSNTDGSDHPHDVIFGTLGDDNIWSGLYGDDLIWVPGGNNTISVSLGNVRIYAGDGNDFIYGMEGDTGTNFIDLGGGDDQVWLPDGNNTILSSSGNNLIGLGNGTSTVTLGDGNDFIYSIDGTSGSHHITLGGGNNQVWLRSGDHIITATGGNTTIGLGTGSATVTTGDGDDVVYSIDGLAGDRTLNLGNGNNRVWLAAGTNTIITGDGDDLIGVGAGNDWVSAGGGNNIVYAVENGGNDVFILSPHGFVMLYGFTVGMDRLGGVTVDQVAVRPGTGESDGNTWIYQQDQRIAELVGISANAVDASVFLAV